MACTAGRDGVLKVGTSGSEVSVAQITSYTVNETADTTECTHFDTTGSFREYKTTLKGFDGSIDVIWYEGSEQDAALDVGEEYSMVLYPAGEGTATDWEIKGDIIVTGLEITAATEDNVTATITFQGTGALTRAEVDNS